MQPLIIGVFICVYLMMAAGRIPGLAMDRTAFAVIGAIVLFLAGAVDGADVLSAIDFGTLSLLFALMVVSAQFSGSGFYDLCAARIASGRLSPSGLLLLVVMVSGALSALLANDVVVFAMTPLLCRGLAGRGIDPRPYVIALAAASNAGSAATVIGNPQNILIGQAGNMDFWSFFLHCAPPALACLLIVHLTVALVWRGVLSRTPEGYVKTEYHHDRGATLKGLLAVAVLIVLFSTPLPHETGALAVACVLLVSRKMSTRTILSRIDWSLLLLFAGLFVVTDALSATGFWEWAYAATKAVADAGDRGFSLLVLSLVGSNTIGNVPAVTLIVRILQDTDQLTLQRLAVFSTLAGNFLLLGSLANIITVERAAREGVRIGFLEHARCGVPMTLASMGFAWAWFALVN